jgi:hypothetical protein
MMSNQWQARRGTTAQNDAFTGASGEITYDTESQGLRIHDGTKQGGYLVDTVVEYQKPTAENNYTWYRKYADGWVEQGGISTNDETPTTLPVTMSDTNYTCVVSVLYNSSTLGGASVMVKTTTSITINRTDSATNASWQVSGMAA